MSCHNSLGRKLNPNWPQLAFPSSSNKTHPGIPDNSITSHSSHLLAILRKCWWQGLFQREGINLPGFMQRKRKSKAINSPWGNMPRPGICQVAQTVKSAAATGRMLHPSPVLWAFSASTVGEGSEWWRWWGVMTGEFRTCYVWLGI